jgi:hypothetical protein
MSRIVAIAVLAAMCVTLFGVDRSALAAQQQRGTPEEVARRLARVQIGDIVYVVRSNGTRLRGVLVAKTDDSITVDVYRTRAFRRPELVGTETLALAAVQEVTTPLTGGQKAAIAAGVVAGFVGVCTAVVLGERTDRRPGLEGSGSSGDARSSAEETLIAPDGAASLDVAVPPGGDETTEAR